MTCPFLIGIYPDELFKTCGTEGSEYGLLLFLNVMPVSVVFSTSRKDLAVMPTHLLLLCAAAFLGGIVGGVLSPQLLLPTPVAAQKSNGVNAEEFLLLDAKGKARAGLGLDANGEVGLVLRSKDGNRTLTLSPDDPSAIKLVERRGQILWGAP
jgi:hypothetical protein